MLLITVPTLKRSLWPDSRLLNVTHYISYIMEVTLTWFTGLLYVIHYFFYIRRSFWPDSWLLNVTHYITYILEVTLTWFTRLLYVTHDFTVFPCYSHWFLLSPQSSVLDLALSTLLLLKLYWTVQITFICVLCGSNVSRSYSLMYPFIFYIFYCYYN